MGGVHVSGTLRTGPHRIIADTVPDDPHEYPLGTIVHITENCAWWWDGAPSVVGDGVLRYLTRDRIWVAVEDVEPYA